MRKTCFDVERLINLYSEEKLREISAIIISAYKKNDQKTLLRFVRNLQMEEKDFHNNRGASFRKMMMFYHPDRKSLLHKTIRSLASSGNIGQLEKLKKYIDLPSAPKKRKKQIDSEIFEREYMWQNPFQEDLKSEDFVHTYKDKTRMSYSETFEFIEAVRALMYGNLPGEFLPKDLYHLDGELNLSEEGICDLSGLEFCINVTELVLSRNNIDNLTEISSLTQLENLDLSYNDITYLDDLTSLSSLIHLDLSFNSIEDVSPLLALGGLRYVNLIGNPIGSYQAVERLERRNIIVLSDFQERV